MFKKLFLTTICGVVALATNANSSRRARVFPTAGTESVSTAEKIRTDLTNMLIGKTNLTDDGLGTAIQKAEECVRQCNTELSQDRLQARCNGIPQTCEQALFLKKVLENVKKVQTGIPLTREEEDEFEAADCYYKGEVGQLVESARQLAAARAQQ